MASAKPSKCITLSNKDHASLQQKKLCQFRKDKTFCDIHVLIGDKEYDCHSNILAAHSKYFEDNLKTASEQSKGITKLDITGILCSHQIFELLLDFMYTGTVEIPVDLIEVFMRESEVFKIDSLRPVITEGVCPEIITFDNVVSLVLTCYKLKYDSLKEQCIAFLSNNFMEIISKELFLKLTEDVLKDVLSRDDLLVDHEDDLIDHVLQWADHWPSERCNKIVDILKSLRWGRISYVKVNAKLIRHPLIRMNPGSLDFIAELSEYFSSGKDSCASFNISDKPRLKSRTSKIVIVGGVLNGAKRSDVLAFDIEAKTWETLPNLPKALYLVKTIVIDNVLFVVGGVDENNQPVNSVFSFDPSENVLRQKASMGTPRCYHGLVAIGSKIFAIGGLTELKDKGKIYINTSSVECYDSVEDSWHPLQQLPAKLRGMAACSSSDGKLIYCFGGRDSDTKKRTDKINVYNVFTDTWVDEGVVLSSPRDDATAVCINDRIFLLGGFNDDELSTVEEYLPSSRIFCMRKDMLSPRRYCTALPLDDKIYVLDSSLEDSNDIDCYDINNDEWIKIDELKDDRWAYGAAILTFKK